MTSRREDEDREWHELIERKCWESARDENRRFLVPAVLFALIVWLILMMATTPAGAAS